MQNCFNVVILYFEFPSYIQIQILAKGKNLNENIVIIEISNYLLQHGLAKLAQEEKYMFLHSKKNKGKIYCTGPPLFINYKRFTKWKKMDMKNKKKWSDGYLMDIMWSLQYLKLNFSCSYNWRKIGPFTLASISHKPNIFLLGKAQSLIYSTTIFTYIPELMFALAWSKYGEFQGQEVHPRSGFKITFL